jgi:hypothetical protein
VLLGAPAEQQQHRQANDKEEAHDPENIVIGHHCRLEVDAAVEQL